MVHIRADGSIDRSAEASSSWVGWLVAGSAVCAVLWSTCPNEASLSSAAWPFRPAVDWFVPLGVASLASVDGAVKVGAVGRWLDTGHWLDPADPAAFNDAEALITLCVAILALHLVAGANLRARLRRHFTASISNLERGRLWCLVGAALAHDDVLHCAGNVVSIASLAPETLRRIGRVEFWCLVVGGACVSSLVSVALHRWCARVDVETRGASGVVCAFLAYAASTRPCGAFHVGSFVGTFALPAPAALGLHLALDALVRRHAGIDALAHLGGAAFGAWFAENRKRAHSRQLHTLGGIWTAIQGGRFFSSDQRC